MASSYYSVDAILTDSQKAPCTFELEVPHLTPLNNGSAIENGMKLELPLWMADMLALSKPAGPSSSLASLDMPAALGPRVINALKADPKSVDIKAQARWFYGLGERMLDLFDEEEMTDVLNDVRMSSDPHMLLSDYCGHRHSSSEHWRLQTRRQIPERRNKEATSF